MPSTELQIDLWDGRWLMVELAEDMSSSLISHTVLTVTSEISNFSSYVTFTNLEVSVGTGPLGLGTVVSMHHS